MTLDTTYTVPEGKVWKVNSYQSGLPGYSTGDVWISINNKQCFISHNYIEQPSSGGDLTSHTSTTQHFPLWLPSNTTLSKNLYNYYGELNSASPYILFLSILEFNTE